MLRVFAIAAIFALAMPTLAMAAPPKGHGPGGPGGGAKSAPHFVPHGGPAPHFAAPHGTAHAFVKPHLGPGAIHPGPVAAHGPFVLHGHSFAWHPVHFPHPWVWPAGYAYRLWAIGAIMPPLFCSTPTYYYADWVSMGLPPPDPGFAYVEYGQDLLLVNTATCEVAQVFPGAFD